MPRLFVGTRRGLFLMDSGESRRDWTIRGPLLEGREVYDALLDPRDGRTAWAATAHGVWGAHVHRSEDGGQSWQVLEATPHYDDARGLKAIWSLAPGHVSEPDTLFAGIEPAGLFRSDDLGRTWRGVDGLNEHRTNATWQPAGGGLALHSVHVDPRSARRMVCALSAGGVYRSDDGGASWRPANQGLRADFLPTPQPESGHCVHKLRQHPLEPDRLYQQNHCGVYRSDDGGGSWTEITAGLPSEFGYALAIDAQDPDVAYVIPEKSSHLRAVVDGRLRVYRTADGGASWRALTDGLPQEHAWVTVLREALTTDALRPGGVYFGTSGGHVFASADGGETWSLPAGFLPRVLSITVSDVPSI
ncbi:MAG: WD40/YVTN/BNR-like repeat-containing protein [Longimicrobiales bacterium]